MNVARDEFGKYRHVIPAKEAGALWETSEELIKTEA
jgi:hypothetical protein